MNELMKRICLLPVLCLIQLPMVLHAQQEIDAPSLEKHLKVLAADSLLGRGFGTPQGLQAAHYIAGQFEEAGIEAWKGQYLHPFIARKGILNIAGNNVIGVVWGTDPDLREEFIVLGAHYDHLGWKIEDGDTVVYNGADDNATGSASIIEIGRQLAASREKLGRSVILVAFDGEESGLIGSNHFLDEEMVDPYKIKLMFSLDMVGMVEKHGGLNMKGVKLLYDEDYLVGELASKYGLSITKATSSVEQRTDTAPFAAIGIPAVAPTSGTESPYHKPEDTSEKLEYEGMAIAANYLLEATIFLSSREQLSDMQGPVEGQPLEEAPTIFMAGIRLNNGNSSHVYKDQFYKGKSIYAVSAGLFANVRLASFLNLQPEILYETKGSQHPDGSFRTHSLTVPLNLQLISNNNDYVRTYWQFGPYYSQHLGGNISGSAIDFENEYMDQEWGYGLGFGMEIMKKVQMGVVFQRELSDLNRTDGNNMAHRVVYFQLGYIF